MPSLDTAEKAKELGNQKMKEGDYKAATEQFTKATEMDATNHEFYSKRCAAFLLQGMHKEALEDANQCIKLNPTWGNGYTRKGEVLEAMQEFTKAQEAYRKAKELGHSTQTEIKAQKTTKTLDRMNWYIHMVRQFMVLMFVVYIVPSPENLNDLGYRLCLLSALFVNAAELYLQYGFPKFTEEYGRHLIVNYRTHYVFSSLLFQLHSPFVFPLIPLVLNEIGFIAHFTDMSLRDTYPERLERYDNLVNTYLGPLMTSYNEVTWMSLNKTAKWTAYNQRVLDACASFEVATVFVLFINLLTRYRSIVVAASYCQLLRLRYIQSPYVKMVFARIHSRFRDGLAGIPPVARVYLKFAEKLQNWTQLPKPVPEDDNSNGKKKDSNCKVM